jgi:hypothetical protein
VVEPTVWSQATPTRPEPLWVTAEKAGIKTASSLWPGDSAIVHGVSPAYLEPRSPPPPSPRFGDPIDLHFAII